MKIFLARHGKTIENEKNIFQGHMDGTLSDTGIEEAKKIATRLSKEKFDVIFCSDLGRAVDTLKYIIKYHRNVPVYFTTKLRDRDAGDVTGKVITDIQWNNTYNVETDQQIKKRAKLFINEVYKKYPYKKILFVGHGGIFKGIMANVRNISHNEMNKMKGEANASLTIIDVNKKGFKEILRNDITHL